MIWFSSFVAVAAVIAWIAEYVVLRYTSAHLARSRDLSQRDRSDSGVGHACIVLCMKGVDPFTRRTLQLICQQDHPNYSVLIVLDTAEDDAREIVEQIDRELIGVPLRWTILENVLPTCSRKLSSLNQAFDSLPDETVHVVNIDADVVPERDWLSKLTTTLDAPNVGIATAIRRYLPDEPKYSGMVRAFWSCFATNWTLRCHIAWGGSLAIHRDTLDIPELREQVRNGFSEDTILSEFVVSRGEEVRVVPDIVEPNREDCTFPALFNFLRRQLLAVKMHHRGWSAISGHGLLLPICIAIAIFHLITARGWFQLASLVAATAYVWLGVMVARYGKRIAETPSSGNLKYGVFKTSGSPLTVLSALVSMPLVYGFIVATTFAWRDHTWRGVSYRLRKGRPVKTISRPESKAGVKLLLDETQVETEASGQRQEEVAASGNGAETS